MNMGDNRAGTVLGNVKSIAQDIDKLISSALSNSARIATNASNSVQGYWNSRSNKASTGSSQQVMNQPIPGSDDSGNGGAKPPQIMANAGGSSGASVGFQTALQTMGYAMGAMPSVNAMTTQNQLTTRAGFFGYGTGTSTANYNQAQGLQSQMFRGGTGVGTLDATNAMLSGQGRGIGLALGNYNNLALGVAAMSNTVPGIGLEGSMTAYAGLQQGRTVNTMRAMGINARDPVTGQPRSYTDIANQIWSKLNREKSVSRAITKEDIANGLLPGSSLDSMLNQIAGNNDALRQQLTSALYAKAGGAKDFSRGEIQRVGGMSDFTAATAARTASAADTLFGVSRAGAAGAEAGAITAKTVSDFANALNNAIPVLSALAGVKGASETIGGAGNSILPKVFGSQWLGGLLSKIPGMAAGGEPQANNAYIVGEKGPELFVPKSNGTIIPNNKLKFGGFRASGGDVSPNDFANSLIKGLGATATPGAVDALTTWMRFEGGHWNNSAAYNPLNTTLNMPGSHSINKVGVDAYTNWDQGLEATIKTLTGPNANSRGYSAIVSAIKSGASKEDILKAINNSAWRTGKTGGSGAYKFDGASSDYNPSGAHIASSSSSGTSNDLSLRSFVPSGGVTNNMGGVTIVINGDKDPQKTAQAVAKILSDQNLVKKAMVS
jgi:hypothetical protein